MTSSLHGLDISKILNSNGPIVKCVMLRANPDTKIASTNSLPLVDDVEELEIDTSPQKQAVSSLLGGKFTFLGQYEDEGTILMVRNIDGLKKDQQPPINHHILQPPFDKQEIRGDILIMKVSATEESVEGDIHSEAKQQEALNHEDFFIDYTKNEYIAFAKRTDIVAPQRVESEEDSESEDHSSDGENDSGVEFGEEDDEGDMGEEDDEGDTGEDDDEGETGEDDDEAEASRGLMNMMMQTILRKFAEENGRGPNTQETLLLRNSLASKLGMEEIDVASLETLPVKRKSDHETTSPQTGKKRVKFLEKAEDTPDGECETNNNCN
jgi:Family of unknown function (DUF5880)